MNRLGWAIFVLIAFCFAGALMFVRLDPERRTKDRSAKQIAVGRGLLMPVAGADDGSIVARFGDPRDQGQRRHEGIDIAAPRGAPVRAVADGVVEKRFFSNGGGGITLYVRGADSTWVYYYAHLEGYAAGTGEGARVRRGQTIGYVGDSGNAGAGNTHLHFEVKRMAPGEPWYRGRPVDPYPLLAGPGR